jgi:hypothetical protein
MFRHVSPCYFRLGQVRLRNFKLDQVRTGWDKLCYVGTD